MKKVVLLGALLLSGCSYTAAPEPPPTPVRHWETDRLPVCMLPCDGGMWRLKPEGCKPGTQPQSRQLLAGSRVVGFEWNEREECYFVFLEPK